MQAHEICALSPLTDAIFERMKFGHSNLEYKMGARAKQEFYLSKQIIPPPLYISYAWN